MTFMIIKRPSVSPVTRSTVLQFFHHLCNSKQEGHIYISYHTTVRSKFSFDSDSIEMHMFLHLSTAR